MTYVTWYCDMQGPEVRSGDLAEPILLERGQQYTFTITEGEGKALTVLL
jgi:pyruvate kinase